MVKGSYCPFLQMLAIIEHNCFLYNQMEETQCNSKLNCFFFVFKSCHVSLPHHLQRETATQNTHIMKDVKRIVKIFHWNSSS